MAAGASQFNPYPLGRLIHDTNGIVKKWVCTSCWSLRARSDIEASPLPTTATVAAGWRCTSCGAVGQFVDEDSSEFGSMFMDLMIDEYQARLRAAAWPVASSKCLEHTHDRCRGLAEDGRQCNCTCHTAAARETAGPPTPLKFARLTEPQLARLKRVGFWYSDQEPHLPRPRDYVDPSWDPAERERAIAYLERCYQPPYTYFGYSWCRLECPAEPPDIGTQDRTDGTWVFPEGLLHYVRHHALKPPAPFLEHMRKLEFQVPQLPEVEEAVDPAVAAARRREEVKRYYAERARERSLVGRLQRLLRALFGLTSHE